MDGGSPSPRRITIGDRTLEALDPELARIHGGEPTLIDALRHPALPEIVAHLSRRGARARLEIGHERVTHAIATRLIAIGVHGIDVPIEGREALHDRVHGAGHWRARLASLRAARRAELHTRAIVLVESTVVDDLAELLPLLARVAHDVALVESGPITAALRARVVTEAAMHERVQLVGFALHGPSERERPVVVDTKTWRALESGVRLPAAEAGTVVAASREIEELARDAGGLRALGLGLAAMGAPAHDLPLCLGGRGRATGETTHVASCLTCTTRTRCGGVPTTLAYLAEGLLAPRPRWLERRAPRRARVLRVVDVAIETLGVPQLVSRLRELGVETSEGDGPVDDCDLVIAWTYRQALDVVAQPLPADARVVIGDFRLFTEADAFVARARRSWPDERIEITSAFPSFAHSYRRNGIPLERITFRPFPLGPLEPQRTAGWALAGTGFDHDDALLESVVDRLAHAGPTIRWIHETRKEARGKLEPVTAPEFARVVDLVSQARFVVMPLRWDRDVTTGGMPLALAHAFGRPIVATRVPMVLDHLRDGVDAILVDPGDVEAMAEAVRRLHHDEPLRRRLAQNALGRAHARSAARWADELVHGAPPSIDEHLRTWT